MALKQGGRFCSIPIAKRIRAMLLDRRSAADLSRKSPEARLWRGPGLLAMVREATAGWVIEQLQQVESRDRAATKAPVHAEWRTCLTRSARMSLQYG